MSACGFTQTEFEKRLLGLKETHESISNLSAWCLSNCKHHAKIVSVWLSILKKVAVQQRLLLFYLANDVIQYSRRQQLPFAETFAPALQKATVLVRDPTVKSKILRLFKIWDERNIYDESFLLDLSGLLVATPKEDSWADLSDFQPTALFLKMRSCQHFEEDTDKNLEALATTKVPLKAIDKYHSTYKERYDFEEVKEELEDTSSKIRHYLASLEKEMKDRESLISQMKTAQEYYDKDFREAKVVSNAYRSFSLRVKNVQRKLDEIIALTPEPIMTKVEPVEPEETVEEEREVNEAKEKESRKKLLRSLKVREEKERRSKSENKDKHECRHIRKNRKREEEKRQEAEKQALLSKKMNEEFLKNNESENTKDYPVYENQEEKKEDKTVADQYYIPLVYTPCMTTGKPPIKEEVTKATDSKHDDIYADIPDFFNFSEEFFTGKSSFFDSVEDNTQFNENLTESKPSTSAAASTDAYNEVLSSLIKQISTAPPPPPPPLPPPPPPLDLKTEEPEIKIEKAMSVSEILESLLQKAEKSPIKATPSPSDGLWSQSDEDMRSDVDQRWIETNTYESYEPDALPGISFPMPLYLPTPIKTEDRLAMLDCDYRSYSRSDNNDNIDMDLSDEEAQLPVPTFPPPPYSGSPLPPPPLPPTDVPVWMPPPMGFGTPYPHPPPFDAHVPPPVFQDPSYRPDHPSLGYLPGPPFPPR